MATRPAFGLETGSMCFATTEDTYSQHGIIRELDQMKMRGGMAVKSVGSLNKGLDANAKNLAQLLHFVRNHIHKCLSSESSATRKMMDFQELIRISMKVEYEITVVHDAWAGLDIEIPWTNQAVALD